MLQLRRLSFLNMLQQRRSSSQICYNREDRRLKYVAAKKIFVSSIL
uniref:Uncharacterized protein n=1 Tax=Cucumis melo TaxID=3656 RepID=A0A9I9E3Z9_CUCME